MYIHLYIHMCFDMHHVISGAFTSALVACSTHEHAQGSPRVPNRAAVTICLLYSPQKPEVSGSAVTVGIMSYLF